MPEWLRYAGFYLALPLAFVAFIVTMVFTIVSFLFMLFFWTLTCCNFFRWPYYNMRKVVKSITAVHFHIIGCFTCDPSWSSKPAVENEQNYQHHYPTPDHVIRMPPPPEMIVSSRSPKLLSTVTAGLSKKFFTFEELAVASNNFSAVNLLGQGGFAYVYKGTLPSGTEVAIKRLKDTRKQTDLEFMKEADILSLVHHRNIVSLIGCCISEKNWLLVYEYVPNKTLDFHLRDRNGSPLSWTDRFKISLDSAKGLAYLHEDCQPRIIHRDIKAANILLDHSFRAKIADFGISKHFSDERTHISTAVKGTYGYLAPEYAATGQLTDKSDVFSYGVLLLELITGQKAVGLADKARPLLLQALENGNYDALVDTSLENNYNPTEMGRMVACASACLCHSASLRPSMSQVVRALEGFTFTGDQSVQVPPGSSSAYILYQSFAGSKTI